jgi:hypothetical protein
LNRQRFKKVLSVDYALVSLPGFNNDVIDVCPDVVVGLPPKTLSACTVGKLTFFGLKDIEM